VQLCGGGSERRLWLIRELGEFLAASRLGMVARRDHPHAAEILRRLQLQYEGNFGFVDLLKTVNEAALRAARVDDEVMRIHPSAEPLRAELEALRRSAQESKAQADAARQALAVMTAERDELMWVEVTPVLTIIRRKLAPGILGRLYRGSKRLLRRGLLRPAPECATGSGGRRAGSESI
jgi:hypothetical protein